MTKATLVPVFAALGDETQLVRSSLPSVEGDASASALAERLPVCRQAIAKHLGVLEEVGPRRGGTGGPGGALPRPRGRLRATAGPASTRSVPSGTAHLAVIREIAEGLSSPASAQDLDQQDPGVDDRADHPADEAGDDPRPARRPTQPAG